MNKTLITFFTFLFCMTSSFGWSLELKDLVILDGLYYKKFTEVPFTGKVKGQIQGSFRKGKKDGSWIEYHSNGRIDFKGEYKNGKKDGSWILYYKNGQLHYKGSFKNGKREGSGDKYWDNGQLMYKGYYKNGKSDGSWVSYKQDGTVWKEFTGTFKDGVKISD